MSVKLKKTLSIIAASLTLVLSGCYHHTVILHPVGIEEIDYATLQNYLTHDYTFPLYIGRPDCSDCVEFQPILEAYLSEHPNAGVYYLNVKAFRDAALKKEATKAEKQFFKSLYKELSFDWTPTLEYVVNGKITQKYQYLDEDYYDIEDADKREAVKASFINEFQSFMDEMEKAKR